MSFLRTPKPEVAAPAWGSAPDPKFRVQSNNAAAVATIAGTATAVPPHLLTREIVKQRIGDVFSLDGKRLEAIRSVIDNSQIDQRHSVFPVDYIVEPRPLAQINAEYREKAVELGLEVTAQALAQADMLPPDLKQKAAAMVHGQGVVELMSKPLREAREIFEREYLLSQVNRFCGNISNTAGFIGMERSALHRKLKALGVG